jgi:hypothetical protein
MNRQDIISEINRKAKSVEQEHPIERYFRVDYVAERLGLSPGAVRKHFGRHPATRYIGSEGTAKKRSYRTMLIPMSALVEFTAD